MENVSQQTEDSSILEETPSICSRIWNCCICPLVAAIGFIGFSLAFAILYTNGGNKDRFVKKVTAFRPVCTCRGMQARKVSAIGAKLSSIQKYPFVGALISERPFIFLCTVIVLTNRFLLTGANCFIMNFRNLRVRVGSDMWNINGSEYGVHSFIINEEFDGTTMENNVALIRVEKVIIMGKTIRPVELTSTSFVRDENGIVLGWNYWATAERQHVRLVEQELLIWKPASCRKYLGNETSSKFICASLNNTLCNLDVTGPLVVNGKLLGFWSWGLSCLDVPSVFTNLHYFKPWIANKIRT